MRGLIVPERTAVDKAFRSGGGTFAICAAILVLMAIGIQLWGAQADSIHTKPSSATASPT